MTIDSVYKQLSSLLFPPSRTHLSFRVTTTGCTCKTNKVKKYIQHTILQNTYSINNHRGDGGLLYMDRSSCVCV